jgi:hypothetical protein
MAVTPARSGDRAGAVIRSQGFVAEDGRDN